MKALGCPHIHTNNQPGMASSFELAIRFTDWASTLPPDGLTWQAIVARWNVSKATAYRWRAAFRAARGISA